MAVSFFEYAGGTLAVEVAGQGPLVICFPALGDLRDAFAPLAAHLVHQGYRVARVDLRGHGDSSVGFDRYGDEAIADDFLRLIDLLGGGPAILAGASLSAGAAVIAAGRRPDQVAALILISPFLRNNAGNLMRRALQLAFMRPWGPFAWRAYSAKLWPGLGAKAKERATTLSASLTRPERWRAFCATFAGADHRAVSPYIGRVGAPVLIVMGEADPDWANPLVEAKWAASKFSSAELIMVPGAGHAPMFERPAVVNAAISRFLATVFNETSPFANAKNKA